MFNKFLSLILALSFSTTLFFIGIKEADASITIGRPPTNNLGLVGYWTMDGGDINWATGTITDRSGNGNTGNLANMSTTTSSMMGKFGQTLRFGGSNPTSGSHIRVPTIAKPTNVTYSMWIKLNSAAAGGGWRVLMEFGDDSPYFGFQSGGGGRIELYNNNPRTTTQLQVGPWYHVVLTSSATESRIYINGVQDGPTGTGNSQNTTSVGIGCHFIDPCFDGFMDDVRIYNRVLSADEVGRLYNSGQVRINTSNSPGTLAEGLVGYWTFDGKDINWATNEALDISGNANHGTLINMSTTTSPTIGKLGQALRFGGHINVSNESNFDFERTQPFSVSAWVYRNSISGSHIIASKMQNGGNFPGWSFEAINSNNYIAVYFRNSLGNQISMSSSHNFFANQWHHVIFTYNGDSSANGIRIYIDGVDRTAGSSGTLTSSMLNNTTLEIGRNSASGSNWNGLIDDVRIYNRVLSQSEVKQLYNLGR